MQPQLQLQAWPGKFPRACCGTTTVKNHKCHKHELTSRSSHDIRGPCLITAPLSSFKLLWQWRLSISHSCSKSRYHSSSSFGCQLSGLACKGPCTRSSVGAHLWLWHLAIPLQCFWQLRRQPAESNAPHVLPGTKIAVRASDLHMPASHPKGLLSVLDPLACRVETAGGQKLARSDWENRSFATGPQFLSKPGG